MPFAWLTSRLLGPPPRHVSAHYQLTVYKFQHLTLPDFLPAINPPEQGKAPGQGAKPGAHPRLGGSHFDPRITIISNPPHPDNFRLTLENENAPPDPAPVKEWKIPDLIAGGPAPTPAPAQSPKPDPAASPARAENPVLELVQALPPAPRPVNASVVAPSSASAAPPPPPPPLVLAAKLPDIPTPHLEVPPPLPPPPKNAAPPMEETTPAPPVPAPAPAPSKKSDAAAAGDKPKPGGGAQIMALSVAPVPLKEVTAIPGGVHNGAFSISPAGTLNGAPGGARGGSPDVGEGGHGPGGDKSQAGGNGAGKPVGGGLPNASARPSAIPSSTPTAAPAVSISGHAGGTDITAGTLPPLKPEDLVYAVKPDTPKARAPSMVVSSGSFGGGGLRMFGVLHGDRIYTIYLSMPGKNWILQYCAQEKTTQVDEASRTVRINIQPPLTPPAALEQFDFHRPPEPPAPPGSMIILHGIIHEDGTVSDLTTLQGLDAISNAAASVAFARWKFKPAQRAGKPVALEILVGIP
jgi:hypothetical protein